MSDPIMHDKMCFGQTADIATLREKVATHKDDMDCVIGRLNDEIKAWAKRDEMLGRLDERLKNMETSMKEANSTLTDQVTKKEDFLTLRNQVWGGVAIIMMLFLTSLFYTAMKQNTTQTSSPSAIQGIVK